MKCREFDGWYSGEYEKSFITKYFWSQQNMILLCTGEDCNCCCLGSKACINPMVIGDWMKLWMKLCITIVIYIRLINSSPHIELCDCNDWCIQINVAISSFAWRALLKIIVDLRYIHLWYIVLQIEHNLWADSNGSPMAVNRWWIHQN